MARKYTGIEINEKFEIIGEAQFVIFGEMADGTKCYHKLVDGVEDESVWYSRARVNGYTVFILEGC